MNAINPAEVTRIAAWHRLVEDVADYQPHTGGFVVDPADLARAIELAPSHIIADGLSVADLDEIKERELRVVGGAQCQPAETLAVAIRLAAIIGAGVEGEVRKALEMDVDAWWEDRAARKSDKYHDRVDRLYAARDVA